MKYWLLSLATIVLVCFGVAITCVDYVNVAKDNWAHTIGLAAIDVATSTVVVGGISVLWYAVLRKDQ